MEYLVLAFCQIMTQKAACELLHIPKSTLSDILHRTIVRLRTGHRLKDIDTIGIDEISYCKGHKYATIVYDIGRQCVVWVGEGKGRETIDVFFSSVIKDVQREKIRFAACDMSQAYMGAIQDWCPTAILVIDRFHIVKKLNEALDEVRKEEWRIAEKDDRLALKGLRWQLFKHSRNRKKSDTRQLNALKRSNLRIFRAWVLKDEFEAFWEYEYQGSAESFILGWLAAVKRSKLKPLEDFASMLRSHWDHIIPFIKTRLTNAVSEGINRIIKIVKNRASGFAHLTPFTDLIYLTVGDLDLPAQIPIRHRTI